MDYVGAKIIATADLKGYGELLTGDEELPTDSAEIIEFKRKKGGLQQHISCKRDVGMYLANNGAENYGLSKG